jgi:hypothetical protein
VITDELPQHFVLENCHAGNALVLETGTCFSGFSQIPGIRSHRPQRNLNQVGSLTFVSIKFPDILLLFGDRNQVQ